LVSLELLTGGACAGQPAVHQRQQVASKTTLIRMAHEDLLGILGVDGNLTQAAVVTLATERAVETNLLAVAVPVERDAAIGRRHTESAGRSIGTSSRPRATASCMGQMPSCLTARDSRRLLPHEFNTRGHWPRSSCKSSSRRIGVARWLRCFKATARRSSTLAG